MTTATKRGASTEADGSEIRRVSEVVGLDGVNFDARCFAEADRPAVFSLLTLLRCCCGAASEAGYTVDLVADERHWRRLRDCPQGDVALAVRRVEKLGDGWQLPGSSDASLLDRLDDYLAALVA
jgi:hypothetical protein